MRRVAGLTLVELLLAVSVMSLMALLAWRGVDGMVRAKDTVDRRTDQVLALQTGLNQWGADLDALALLPQTTSLDWNGRAVRIVRRGTANPEAGVRVVAWTQHRGQWLRWQSPHLATRGEVDAAWEQADAWSRHPGDMPQRQDVAVTGLQTWQLYFFRGGSWSNPMSSDALEAGPAGRDVNAGPLLPDGVRLVLVLPPGEALSGRVVRDWVSPKLGGGKS